MPRPVLRTCVSILTAASVAGLPLAPASGQAIVTRQDYETCQTQDEQSFATAVSAIAKRSLQAGLAGIDYKALVSEQWRKLGIDATIDKQVDIAVEEVRNETSLSNLVRSIANQEKAQQLATAVAERVYKSDAVKTAIEQLAAGVGGEAGKRIELASQDAAEPALQCLKAFLGPRYGATVASTVVGAAAEDYGLKPSAGGAEVSSGSVLQHSSDGMTGAAILIMRRQLANMATRVGQRIAGSVLARIVSVVAGGVGLVLIAKDIWDLRKGVLPIVAEEMKSPATKETVQAELATEIGNQISIHLDEISTKVGERMLEVWREFRRAHAVVLDLAERDPKFRTFLDSVRPDLLPRLGEVTSLVLQEEGEPGLLRRLNDGSLDETVKALPDDAFAIARETRSIEKALQWASLSGPLIGKVVDHELHKRSSPDQFTKSSLERLFAVDDRLAIMRLAAIDRDARDVLFERKPDELKTLARQLDERELSSLARYVTSLPQVPRERVLAAVAADTATMKILASASVREAVIASRDPAAAVDMMLRPETGNDAKTVLSDLQLAWNRDVHPVLIWEKHPILVILLGAASLIVLLLLIRLITPRRRPASPGA